jgi:hypothetical protein
MSHAPPDLVDPMFVHPALLRYADLHFPRLMEHPTNQEDAFQELRLVQHVAETLGEALASAGPTLAWLEYDLGLTPKPPEGWKPSFPPAGELTRGTFVLDVDLALEVERDAAPRAAA